MIKLIYLILYACSCILLAEDNAIKIQNGTRIKHFWNGLIHLCAASIAYYLFGWKAALSVLLVARLFFDVALNIFRGLPIDYVSQKPKSIVDRIEKYLFKLDGISPKIIYLAILICLQIIK